MNAAGPLSGARHPPGVDRLGSESWSVEFADDGGRGGFLRLTVFPHLRTTWLWAAWAHPDGTVVVRDHDVPLPRSGLEVRSSGLWADVICESDPIHWTFGLEAFGLSIDDPVQVLQGGEAGERGDRVPLGFDIEWEALEPPIPFAGAAHHEGAGEASDHRRHLGRIHGDVLVGTERLAFDGWGHRDHSRGVHDWWSAGRHAAGGRVGDVTFSVADPAHATAPRAAAHVGQDGTEAELVDRLEFATQDAARGLPTTVTYRLDDWTVAGEVLQLVPLRIPPTEGTMTTHLLRGLCRFSAGEATGSGWAEWSRS